MRILCGIDIVEVDRISKNIKIEKFCNRVFTKKEIDYCESKRQGAAQSYAARFAVKEAFSKALGTGIAKGISLTDIEVDKIEGKPVINLYNRAHELLCKMGSYSIDVSISHTDQIAIANVVILITTEKKEDF